MKILITITIVSASLTICLFLASGHGQRQKEIKQGTRERRTSASATIPVKKGENLQKAIDQAQYGDTIVLEPGVTYRGPIILPYKDQQTDKYVTITTSDSSTLPPANERVVPERHAQAMPKIIAPDNGVAVGTAEQAHHYQFIGIEFAPDPDARYLYNLIDLGRSDYKSLSQFPHDLIFDRCYIHSTGLNKARRGVGLNSGGTSIINSHISGFAGVEDETQGLCGWNGPGPFHIVNNYIEGGTQNIMFGGADPAVPNLVPSGIEIRKNFLYKPPEWYGRASIKATIELKNARNVVIDGNVLECAGLNATFVLTVRNQNGAAPWSILEDITVTNNIVRHSGMGFNILGSDTEHHSQQAKRIRIANNLLVDLVPDYSAVFIAGCCADTVTVENNTVQQTGNIMTCYGPPSSNFVFRSNIVQYNSYGFACPANALSVDSRGNIIADNSGAIAANGSPANIPRNNLFVSSYNQVGFVDVTNGDWRLSPQSKIRRKGVDGSEPGVNFEALEAAVATSDVEPPYFGKKRK